MTAVPARIPMADLHAGFVEMLLADNPAQAPAAVASALSTEFGLTHKAALAVVRAVISRCREAVPPPAPVPRPDDDDPEFLRLLVQERQRREVRARLDAEARGAVETDAEVLADVDLPAPDRHHLVAGWPLLADSSTLLFADGGSLKSFLALYAAGWLTQQREVVLFIDWELSAAAHRERLGWLFPDSLPTVHYLRCDAPLAAEVGRIRRNVERIGATFLVFDSVGFAAGGPLTADDTALAYFRAVRQLGPLGSLHLAHITKSGDGEQKAFGSAFWHNAARATWFLDTSPAGSTRHLTLWHRKATFGPLQAPVRLRMEFSPGVVAVVGDDPIAVSEDHALDRVVAVLRESPGSSGRQVKSRLAPEVSRRAVEAALRLGRDRGVLTVRVGERRAEQFFVEGGQ